MNTLADFEFRVRSYECSSTGEATLASICNYLQESASWHARILGFSKADFEEKQETISWILTRMRVKMFKYPRWMETVKVTTFPRRGRRITVYRDYELRVGDELIGIATSEWMIIDLKTRKLAPIPEYVFQLANDERSPVIGDEAFSRLKWDCREPMAAKVFAARRGDIDLNGHVNNVHYVEWLVEALPDGCGAIRDFEIVFKSETLAGDEVRSEAVEVEPQVYAAHVAAPDAQDHVVARIVV